MPVSEYLRRKVDFRPCHAMWQGQAPYSLPYQVHQVWQAFRTAYSVVHPTTLPMHTTLLPLLKTMASNRQTHPRVWNPVTLGKRSYVRGISSMYVKYLPRYVWDILRICTVIVSISGYMQKLIPPRMWKIYLGLCERLSRLHAKGYHDSLDYMWKKSCKGLYAKSYMQRFTSITSIKCESLPWLRNGGYMRKTVPHNLICHLC